MTLLWPNLKALSLLVAELELIKANVSDYKGQSVSLKSARAVSQLFTPIAAALTHQLSLWTCVVSTLYLPPWIIWIEHIVIFICAQEVYKNIDFEARYTANNKLRLQCDGTFRYWYGSVLDSLLLEEQPKINCRLQQEVGIFGHFPVFSDKFIDCGPSTHSHSAVSEGGKINSAHQLRTIDSSESVVHCFSS